MLHVTTVVVGVVRVCWEELAGGLLSRSAELVATLPSLEKKQTRYELQEWYVRRAALVTAPPLRGDSIDAATAAAGMRVVVPRQMGSSHLGATVSYTDWFIGNIANVALRRGMVTVAFDDGTAESVPIDRLMRPDPAVISELTSLISRARVPPCPCTECNTAA